MLGCGQYEVYFQTRGGDTFVCRARNLVSLTFNRLLNDTSEATAVLALNGQDSECCACAGSIDPWEHEMAIFRDGVEVWVGPIVNIDIDLDSLRATFFANDLFAWTDRRWVELPGNDYEVEEVEMASVFDWLLSHGYYKDPWNMQWTLSQTGIPLDKFYPGFEAPDRWGGLYPTVGDELRQLTRSGCDFTVYRRVLIGGGIQVNPPVEIPRLIDTHWAKLPTIKVVGSSMATEVGVAGGNSGTFGYYDDQMWIEATDDEYRARYGLLQRFYAEPELDEEDTTFLPNAITQTAYGLREIKKQPYTYIQGGELAQGAPIEFEELIPGAVISVGLLQTCRTIDTDYRLTQVSVTYDADRESVAVEMTPKGVEALRT